jgi:hypothetical protein
MIIPHINLGQIGVVGDQNGQALPSNAWTDSLNVRFTPLGLEKIAESTLRIPQNTTFQIFTTKLRNEQVYVFAASRNGLHMYSGEDWYFTPAEIGEKTIWQFTHWGDTVIFSCPEYAPFMFDWDTVEDPDNAQNSFFVPLPKWGMISTEWDLTTGGDPSFDTEARCERLIAYKSQLVAVGIKQKEPIDAEIDPENPGDESPVYEKSELKDKSNVVWVSNTTSDPTYKLPEGNPGGGADAGLTGLTAGGPPSWDYISPATLSVQQVVGAADGRYIAAEQLNESIIIYTATAAHALIFTGGQYVVQTRRLFQRGAAGPQCVVEFGNNHFVIDGDQLYIHDGSTATRVGEDMFDVEFFKRAVNLKSATLCHDPENREIWIYFDTNYGRKSCIYSYATGTFGWGDGEAKSAPITYASRGYLPQSGAQWGDMTQPWKDFREPDDYLLWPEEWSQSTGIPKKDVTPINVDESYDGVDDVSWMITVGEDDLIVSPPYKWGMKWKTSGFSFDEGETVRLLTQTLALPYSFGPEVTQTYRYRLKINGDQVTDQQAVNGESVSRISQHQFVWKESYNPSSGPTEFELEVDYDEAAFNDGAGSFGRFAWRFQGADRYQTSTINSLYDGQEQWRWGDQYTYTNAPKILALTSLGIHQKEAFFANNRECWVERKAIDLDDAGINGWVIKHLKQYHMQIAGEGKVGIRTGWAESALADPQWEKPTWLDDNGDGSYQADMRTTGRYLSLRFEFKEMSQFRWANGYMDVEVSGRR